MQSQAPTIGTFVREKNRDFAEGLVMGWLVYLNDILNLKRPMTEDQVELCAVEILNDYHNLKISDLTLLFKNIIAGKYGEFYESLTIPKVLTFFRDYYEERLEIGMIESQRKHNDFMNQNEFDISTSLKRKWRNGK